VSRLAVSNLSMQFGDFVAVDSVSFEVPTGSFITLLGPSGCGKTTLLRMISGFLKPTSGSIHIGDDDVTLIPPERRDTAMCFQSYALFPHLTVEQNVGFGPKQKALPKEEQARVVDEAVQQVELENQVKKLPNELSGGQQQRVALARALAMQSNVILFDEPLSNLDARLRDTVRHEIRALQREHKFTAVYVTHDQSEALAMSDVILVMNHGRIEQMGSPSEIYQSPTTEFVADFIGNANLMPATVRSAEGSSCRVLTEFGSIDIDNVSEQVIGSKIKVCWRPESARVLGMDESSDQSNTFEMNVAESVFQGNITTLHISKLNEKNVLCRVEVHGFCDHVAGDSVHIHIPSDAVIVLETPQ